MTHARKKFTFGKTCGFRDFFGLFRGCNSSRKILRALDHPLFQLRTMLTQSLVSDVYLAQHEVETGVQRIYLITLIANLYRYLQRIVLCV